MTDATLLKGSGTFTTSGTATLTLYNTQSEEFRKSANLIQFNIPASDSDSTIAFDFLGTTREVTIRGKVTTSDAATLTDFTGDLNSLINGSQGNTGGGTVGYTFDPVSLSGTFKVYVNDVTWTYVAGEANTIEYTVTLFQINSTNSA